MSFNQSDPPLNPPPPGVESNYADLIDVPRTNMFIICLTFCMFCSSLSVLARVYTRIFIVRLFGWDDALAVIAMGLNIGLAISFVGLFYCGLSFIPWNISLDDFGEIYLNDWIYWNAIFTLLLYITYPFIKLSILMLYLRLLGPVSGRIRFCVWLIVFFNVAILAGTVASLLKMCDPPAALFYPWIPGTCNINDTVPLVQAALQLATDLLVLIPPIPIIWRLNIPHHRKMEVLLPLTLGLFVTIFAIARLVLLVRQLNEADFAVDISWQGTFLAIFEINFAIVAICLPALKQLYLMIRSVRRKKRPTLPDHGQVSASSDATSSTPRKIFKPKRSFFSQLLDSKWDSKMETVFSRQDEIELSGDDQNSQRNLRTASPERTST